MPGLELQHVLKILHVRGIGIVANRMRVVLQRVTRASVTVDGAVVGAIDAGLLVLLGVAAGDTVEDAERLAEKLVRLRVFERDGRFGESLVDTGGAALVVSQFTLLAETAKGNRPSFSGAARAEEAEPLYERFCVALGELGVPVETGVFGARMEVELVNDGPVTIVLDL
jgi:D-tyrosyl-tRNA(Tyr) deacylase